MRNLPIVGKFFIIMAVFALFALGSTLYLAHQTTLIGANYAFLINGEEKAAVYLARSNRSLQAMRAEVGDMLMAHTAEDAASADKELRTAREGFIAYMDTAIAAQPGRDDLVKLKTDGLAIVDATCAPTLAAARSAKTAEDTTAAYQLHRSTCQPAFQSLSPVFTKITSGMVEHAENTSTALSEGVGRAIVTSLAVVIAGLLVVLGFGFFAVRSWLVRPIETLSGTMNRLAEGQLEEEIEALDRRDEIGRMAKSVQIFKENSLRNRQLEQEAESNRSANEAEQARSAAQERRRAQEMLQATTGLAEGLKHLSGGDLSFRLTATFAEDFESLRADFNAAVAQLSDSMQAVASATGTIDGGAREISRSADDLSKRTEQQAASLEETAAALDEITANVANSSKRAEEAR
ncbi:HAMP domain-containing protein, partial [Rhizobium sp. YIM 134829]|uniref:HAMP domain-containing protein n=1 Tax=Rhizobium sp. YIM 134829 TaxID=3390453 RepID=UPI00397AFB50